MAGSRFSVRLAGSMVMPTDSSAVTPSTGSTSPFNLHQGLVIVSRETPHCGRAALPDFNATV